MTKKHGLYLAAQCCEHLNRALIIEEECAEKYGLEMVNVKPQLKAGGSFSTAAWNGFEHPCAVEFIKAHAGIDIGDTLIGMHLRHVAVPVRTTIKSIGSAHVVCARTRLKYIGGERAAIRNKKGAVALTCGSSFYISNTKRELRKARRSWYNQFMRLNKIIQRDYTSFSLYYQIKLPLDLEISIPSDDPVRLVSAFVEEMDLSELYKTYGRIRKIRQRRVRC